jgi:hypothetical protein
MSPLEAAILTGAMRALKARANELRRGAAGGVTFMRGGS